MSKSKHPDLIAKAADHYAAVVKQSGTFQKDGDAFYDAAKKVVSRGKSLLSQVTTHTKDMAPVLERYVQVATAIIGLEQQLATAKSAKDKAKQKTLEAEIKKSDKTADKLRSQYRDIDAARRKAMRELVSGLETLVESQLPVKP